MCFAFRTFQGWTALPEMDHDQGVLHTVPVPETMAYLLPRPLLADVPEDDMCGVTINQVSRRRHLAPPAL
ncbi:YbiU family protein [Streptomyces wuyuanensis]|uniref:YbiU family protein n=1 Tax=Streptomyces wuyuanensis TaxID=1196353 RepID=UPI0037156CE0